MNQSSPSVAVLIDTSTSWGRRLIRGITNFAQDHGWHLLVTASGVNEPIHLPMGWTGDGVIARVSNKPMAAELTQLKKPVVNVSSIDIEGVGFPKMQIDYNATAAMAAEHLRDCRYERFAYVGPLGESYCSNHANAFKQAVTDAGKPYDSFELEPLSTSSQDWIEQRERLIAWLKALPKPVGVFTWGTEPGQEVLDACREQGIAVPVEVGLLADDDDPLLCNTTTPPMSAIRHASERLGYLAAERLDSLIHNNDYSSARELVPPVQVTCRSSTDASEVEDDELHSAILYIRQNVYGPLTVSEIADAVPMTRRALERKFRQAFDRTPMTHVRLLRLAKARDLLANTDLPISTVAYQSGFSSGEYLAKTFDRHYQLSPLAYRKKFR